MNNKTLRTILSLVLTLLLMFGSIPVQSLEGVLGTVVSVYAEDMYTITVEGGLEHGRVVSDVSSANEGGLVTLTPYPDEGYYLSQWQVCDENGSSITVRDNTFEMPAGPVTVSAAFEGTELQLGSNPMVGVNGEYLIYSFTPEASGTYHFSTEGYESYLDFTLYNGDESVYSWTHAYDQGSDNSVYLEAGVTYELEVYASTAANTILLITAAQHVITVESDPENGSVTSSAHIADEGETVTLTAIPNEGYRLSKWGVKDESGNEIPVVNNEFIMPAGDVYISPVFSEPVLNIGENYIVVTGAWESVEYSFTAAESGKYRFYSSNDDGDPWAELTGENEYSVADDNGGTGKNFMFEAVIDAGANYQVDIASSEARQYTVWVEKENLQSLVIGENYVSIPAKKHVEYCFTPAESATYHFYSTITGTRFYPEASLYCNNFSFSYVSYSEDNNFKYTAELKAGKAYILDVWEYYGKSTNFNVIVEIADHSVVVDSGIEHGTVTSSKSIAADGDTVSLTAVPDEGYYLAKWLVTDESGNEITVVNNEFTMPTENVTVSALFGGKELQTGNNPMVGENGEHLSYSFTPEASGTYHFSTEGDVSHLDFNLYNGDESVSYWTHYYGPVSDVSVNLKAGVTYDLDAYVYTAANTILSVTPAQYAIALDTGLENGSVTSSADIADEGEAVTLTAVPAEGYYLSRWEVTDESGNEINVVNNEFTMPTENVTVSALFGGKELHTGSNPMVGVYDENLYYNFTPSESGTYHFSTEGYESNLSFNLYNGNELVSSWSHYYAPVSDVSVYLEAGVTYDLEVHAYTTANTTLLITAAQYAITLDTGLENGSVTSSADIADEGETVTLTAVPDEGYCLSKWGVTDGSGNEIPVINNEFVMPAGNVYVSPVFSEPVLNIGENYIVVTDAGETAKYSFTAAESGKYRFYSSNDDGDPWAELTGDNDYYVSDNDGGTGNNFKFEAVLDAGITYNVNIGSNDARQYTVWVEKIDVPSIGLGENNVAVLSQETMEYCFIPTESIKYHFYSTATGTRYDPEASLYCNDPSFSYSSTYIDSNNFMITADLVAGKLYILDVWEYNGRPTSFNVSVEIAEHSVTVDPNLEHGRITPSGSLVVDGETVYLTISPASGYYLSRLWVRDEDGAEIPVTDNSFVMPKKNVSISAEFIEKPLYIMNGENRLPSKSTSWLSYYFIPLESGTYTFYSVGDGTGDPQASLSGHGINISDDDSGEDMNFSFTVNLTAENRYTFKLNSRSDMCYTVMVEAPKHSIAVDEGIVNGTVTASAAEAAMGDTVTLEVVPNEYYTVGGVFINGAELEPVEGAYTFAMPAENVIISAVFESLTSNVTSVSMDFNGKMFLITYIKLSQEIMSDPDAYISTTLNGTTTNHSVSELIKDLDAQGRVKVRQEIHASMIQDEMTLEVFNGADEVRPLTFKESTEVRDCFDYAALEYLKERQQNSANPNMVELARAAELYGIAVQVYFNYHIDQLTAEEIAAMEAAADAISIPSTCEETLTGALPAGISKRTMTVLFESDNTLRQYFYIDDASIGNYTFTLNGNPVAPSRKESGKYYVEQSNIASGLLSTGYTFTVSDGTDTFEIDSSALGYAYNRQEKSSNQSMIRLSRLLYRYSQAADAYFGTIN